MAESLTKHLLPYVQHELTSLLYAVNGPELPDAVIEGALQAAFVTLDNDIKSMPAEPFIARSPFQERLRNSLQHIQGLVLSCLSTIHQQIPSERRVRETPVLYLALKEETAAGKLSHSRSTRQDITRMRLRGWSESILAKLTFLKTVDCTVSWLREHSVMHNISGITERN
jgi:hypothetical protein